MQIVFSQAQANQVADKLMDLGNLSLAGMVIGQLVPGVPFNPGVALLGVLSFAVAYTTGYYVMRGGDI